MINFDVEIEGETARVMNLVSVVFLYIELSISFYRVFHAFVAQVLTFPTYPYFTWSYFCV